MSLSFLLCFAFGAALLSGPPSFAGNVCVLDYETTNDPISQATTEVFSQSLNAKLIVNAIPEDLLTCFTSDYEEILLIAHAVQNPERPDDVSLGYFKMTGPPPAEPEIREFMPEIFRDILQQLRTLKAQGHPTKVQRLRWMSCLPEKIFQAYPELPQILKENQIALDSAPSQILMSLLSKENVTGYDRLWLAESAQPDPDQSHDQWFFCYLDLQTLFVIENGSSVCLHGKYKIRYQGISLGLASRWTPLYLRYADIQNLSVGEKTKLRGLHLDFSLGLGEDVELDLVPRLAFEIPSDLNSAGISFGIWNQIEVVRVY